MKKKIIIFIIIILIITVGILIGLNKIKEAKISYDIVNIETYNYFKYNENGKYGVIDKDGNIVIEAQYDDIVIPNLEKDIFICYNKETDKNTVLNSSKEELFTDYQNIEAIKLKNIANVLCYEKSVLKYEKDGLYGLIDFEGKEITKNIYTSIENLQSTEGKFLVSQNEKYGVINLKGTVLVKSEYDEIKTDGYYTEQEGYQKSGFIVSQKTDDGYRYGYISYDGKEILKENYNDIIRITNLEEVYLIASENGQYGLYKEKKEVIKPQYQSITYTENGAVIVQKNKNYGIANLKGEQLVEAKYTSIEEKGIYLYAENSSENQVYDIDGNKISMNYNKEIYKTDNENYRIVTLLNNDITYYGIENAEGVTLVNANYRYLEYLYNDYFIAEDENNKLGVINANEKVLIEFKYDVIQKIKDKNILQTLNTKTNETEIYSSNLELACTMEDATIDNKSDYIIVYNDEERLYFDNNGNKINEDSEIIKNAKTQTLPEKIEGYKKVQYSLDNAYYIKD